ncbi:molecular chaperone [Halomicroarcula sp. GCM10025709]|uniref:TorD/DmsD family molecular chaperone n=1 Tax=Halomicroarcula sp. GCM10025709 TaxID=3252669 RepID=UPI00361E94CE
MTETPAFHAARAGLYAAVAGAFVYPEAATVEELTDRDALEGIERAGRRTGVEAEAAAFTDALADCSPVALQAEYNDLFGVPDEDGTYAVVPYEGNYTVGSEIDDEQRRIAAVVGLLETVGLEPSDEFRERQDHVATELELMQVAAGQRAVVHERASDPEENEVLDEIVGVESAVLSNHLIDFVPAFAHDVREATDCDVYLAAADLAQSLVESDESLHPPAPADPDDISERGWSADERR